MLALSLMAACRDDPSPSQDTEGATTTIGAVTTTGSTTVVDEAADGETESSSESTTGPSGCMEDADCPDAESPLCGPEGQCVACSAAGVEGDAGCAAKAMVTGTADGVCAEDGPRAGQCVECTEDALGACTGVPPMCDVKTNTCMPCVEHGQCGAAACNLFTGECLPAEAVVHVGPGEQFETLGEAVASFGKGAAVTVVVHQANYDEAVTVEGGSVLAFLAAGGDVPLWVLNAGGAPQLTVGDATVVLEGMQLSGNAATAHPAVRVTGGRVWVDRGRVIGNDGGGVVAEDGAELVLRNCFMGGNVSDVDVISIDGSSLEMVYTTVGGGGVTEQRARALSCEGVATAEVRNSILVSFDPMPAVECVGATLVDSATEAEVGNLTSMWFDGYAAGDFHLTGTGATTFQGVAQWSPGDPPTDIDGDLRPTTDGATDHAGADVP